MKLTFTEAFYKITESYISGKINPFDADTCFCAVLSGGRDWYFLRMPFVTGVPVQGLQNIAARNPYSGHEYYRMDKMFISTLFSLTGEREAGRVMSHPYYEEALFKAMSKTLDVLKQIHIDRSEVIQYTAFKKRI